MASFQTCQHLKLAGPCLCDLSDILNLESRLGDDAHEGHPHVCRYFSFALGLRRYASPAHFLTLCLPRICATLKLRQTPGKITLNHHEHSRRRFPLDIRARGNVCGLSSRCSGPTNLLCNLKSIYTGLSWKILVPSRKSPGLSVLAGQSSTWFRALYLQRVLSDRLERDHPTMTTSVR